MLPPAETSPPVSSLDLVPKSRSLRNGKSQMAAEVRTTAVRRRFSPVEAII